MPNIKNLPGLIMLIGYSVVLSGIVILLFTMVNSFFNTKIPYGQILGMSILLFFSLFNFFLSRIWNRISELNARFVLDDMPQQMMKIEEELKAGDITNGE